MKARPSTSKMSEILPIVQEPIKSNLALHKYDTSNIRYIKLHFRDIGICVKLDRMQGNHILQNCAIQFSSH